MSGTAPPSATIAGRVPRDGRRQRLQARIAWGALAADATAFAAICAFVDFDSIGTVLGITVMTVPMVVAIALFVWGLQASVAARRFGRLGRDEGVVTSWIVDAGTWRERMAFRTEQDRRSVTQSQGIALLPDKAPPGGIEIVIGDEGIFIGERVFMPVPPGFAVPVQMTGSSSNFPRKGPRTCCVCRSAATTGP